MNLIKLIENQITTNIAKSLTQQEFNNVCNDINFHSTLTHKKVSVPHEKSFKEKIKELFTFNGKAYIYKDYTPKNNSHTKTFLEIEHLSNKDFESLINFYREASIEQKEEHLHSLFSSTFNSFSIHKDTKGLTVDNYAWANTSRYISNAIFKEALQNLKSKKL